MAYLAFLFLPRVFGCLDGHFQPVFPRIRSFHTVWEGSGLILQSSVGLQTCALRAANRVQLGRVTLRSACLLPSAATSPRWQGLKARHQIASKPAHGSGLQPSPLVPLLVPHLGRRSCLPRQGRKILFHRLALAQAVIRLGLWPSNAASGLHLALPRKFACPSP